LCEKPTTNLYELRQRAAKFMRLKELREFKNQARAEAGGDKGKEKEKECLSRPVVGKGDRHKDNRGTRFIRYTPLSANRGRTLDEALSADQIPPPRRAVSPKNVDRIVGVGIMEIMDTPLGNVKN